MRRINGGHKLLTRHGGEEREQSSGGERPLQGEGLIKRRRWIPAPIGYDLGTLG